MKSLTDIEAESQRIREEVNGTSLKRAARIRQNAMTFHPAGR
jgi:hypothetical protein